MMSGSHTRTQSQCAIVAAIAAKQQLQLSAAYSAVPGSGSVKRRRSTKDRSVGSMQRAYDQHTRATALALGLCFYNPRSGWRLTTTRPTENEQRTSAGDNNRSLLYL